VCVGATKKNPTKLPKAMAKKRASLIFSSSPSRAGVEGCPDARSVLLASGLRLRRSPGLAIRFDCFHIFEKAIRAAARPSHSGPNRTIQSSEQWHAPKISALQSRGGDGFAPSSLAQSLS
jgi:hypothetical protein